MYAVIVKLTDINNYVGGKFENVHIFGLLKLRKLI